ncbi:MAG: hypothetical protein ACLP9L_28605 [Thermoguttaceae bacterium]
MYISIITRNAMASASVQSEAMRTECNACSDCRNNDAQDDVTRYDPDPRAATEIELLLLTPRQGWMVALVAKYGIESQ